MVSVGMYEAKTNLSKLVEDMEAGRNDCIELLRRGKPVARIVLIDKPRGLRFGCMKGRFTLPDDFLEQDRKLDREVEDLFCGEDK